MYKYHLLPQGDWCDNMPMCSINRPRFHIEGETLFFNEVAGHVQKGWSSDDMTSVPYFRACGLSSGNLRQSLGVLMPSSFGF